MTGQSDYDIDFDEGPAGSRAGDEWDDVWNTGDRNRDTMRKIELGLAVIASAVALFVVRAGWLRMSRPRHIVPSAADIHVRMPPPR